ncbi:MAG: ribonuclease P protein component [Chloroflexi bacterium]|nr:ribonuclease P protein component [Chloroflexota bacterium]
MRKEERLRKGEEFASVYRNGRIWSNNLLVLRVNPNDFHFNRYGFVVSKRVGNAVIRNRVRRRLREIAKSIPTGEGRDFIVTVRSQASSAGFAELKNALEELFKRGKY